jgi:hypothetical protein
LFGDFGVFFHPLEYIRWVEVLSLYTVGSNTALDECIEYITGILLLSVPVEWHRYLRWWSLELWGIIAGAGERLDEYDVAV